MFYFRIRWLLTLAVLAVWMGADFADFARAAEKLNGNRLVYLDDFCEPYYVHQDFPKLTTPQWIGEAGVECVVTLGIDDMRNIDAYETYLRPILDRLKKIDGRAPVSIMTNDVDPKHSHLQTWLREGLSIETHTIDHPCPCLQNGDFKQAKSTYDRCVDRMAQVPNNRPVAFRFPCCDSRNTPSPRAFAEILSRRTPDGNFLQMSTSVCCLLSPNDPALPAGLVLDADGRPRFAKYVPFPSFVNKVENYPYPFVIGRLLWEFPIAVPDDWQGQHLHAALNPKTVEDMQACLDATAIKQGTMNVVFHPHGWIRNQQIVQFIDYAHSKYADKMRFLNFSECLQRLNKHLLVGQPLRSPDGNDNGVRLLDVNNDGYLDVLIGNDELQRTRIWSPDDSKWNESAFPAKFVTTGKDGNREQTGVRFGLVGDSSHPVFIWRNEQSSGGWRWDGAKWIEDQSLLSGLEIDGKPLLTARAGNDVGVRLRDLDRDGCCELLVANSEHGAAFRWNSETKRWSRLPLAFPEGVVFVDKAGRDAGLRLIDVDEDGLDDLVFSNETQFSVCGFADLQTGWSRVMRQGKRGDADSIPMIARRGTNNGAWFARGDLWVQNEDTHRLADGVARASFAQLQGDSLPAPKSPDASLRTNRVPAGLKVELVASEPLTMDPVNFDWGPDGKLWVVEMADYPLGLDDKGKPGGRVRYLEDTDDDGRYDKSTLFLDGLAFPTGVMAWRKGVLISAAPDILYAEDTDGDGRADRREVLYTGFGQGNQQHRVNGFCRGLDNWIYLANGDSGGKIRSIKTGQELNISGRDLRIRPDDGAMEAQIGQTQFGRSRDDWGNWFGCNNAQPMYHFVLDDHYLRRNPYLSPPSARLDLATLDSSPIYPAGRVVSHWEGYRPPAPGEASRFTSACSVAFYRDNLFGPTFAGSVFIGEPVHSLVHRQTLTPDGVTFKATPANQPAREEFFASSDPWCRPTTIRTGPDGAVWIADMYRLVIEHPQWIDDDVVRKLDLRAGHDRGRIYRVSPSHAKLRPIPRLDRLDSKRIVELLESPNGAVRDLAQQWLVKNADDESAVKEIVPRLEALAEKSSEPLGRLHALCTLDGLRRLKESIVIKALADEHAGVRRHAVRLAEPFLASSERVANALLELRADRDPHVQLQLAYALGEWHHPRAGQAIAELLLREGDDPFRRAALLSSIGKRNAREVLTTLLARQRDERQLGELLPGILRICAAMGNSGDVEQALKLFVARVNGDNVPTWQLSVIASALEALAGRKTGPYQIKDGELSQRILVMTAFARTLVASSEAAETDRLVAIRLLAAQATKDDIAALLAGLISPSNPAAVQIAAVDAVGTTNRHDVPKLLLSEWRGYSPAIRSRVIDLLLSREPWTSGLLAAIERGQLTARDIDATRRQRLLALDNKTLRERAARHLENSTQSRRQVLEDHQDVLKLTGDPEGGRAAFAKRCAACHRLDGVGVEIGASLQAIGNRSPQALLTAILDPNQAIEDRFLEYVITTADGRSQTGIIAAETGTSVILRAPEGKEVIVLRREIDSLRSTGKSLMPEGLEKDLTKQDLADVIAYIGSHGPRPKTLPGNQPATIHAAADGSIQLRASQCRIYGSTLIFEQEHQNLGFWHSHDDEAIWSFAAKAAGRYNIILEFACENSSSGNRLQLKIDRHLFTAEVPGTGSWSEYKQLTLGEVELARGAYELTIKPLNQVSNYLMDLRTILLKPVKSSSDTRPANTDATNRK